ncbi:MAG: PP2C family protein-serine/threonine phosphatase [Herpetosiphon sp.]
MYQVSTVQKMPVQPPHVSGPAEMLAGVIETHNDQLRGLADEWLAEGADTFGIWSEGHPVLSFPEDRSPYQVGLTAPILVSGQMIGELRVTGAPWAKAATVLVSQAEHVSQIIELEYALEDTGEPDIHDQLSGLYQFTQGGYEQFDLGQMLFTLAKEAALLLKAEGGFTLLKIQDDAPLLVQYPQDRLNGFMLPRLVQQLRSHVRAKIITSPEVLERLAPDVHNLILAQIRIHDSFAGVLGLWNKPNNEFPTRDIKLIRAIVVQAGIQLEQVLRHRESVEQARITTEIEMARTVQRQLLPQAPPQIEGLEIAMVSHSALEMCGDFYDLVNEPQRPFIFSVGDVSGKGMAAALLMAMTRTVIHAAARCMPAPSPTKLVTRVNEDLYNDFTEVNMFATMFVGYFDVGSKLLTYTNAGHSPVIYRSNDGTAGLLEAGGPPVGVLPLFTWEHQSLPLGPGDILVVATDGFSERRNDEGELFGYQRLLQLIDAHAQDSPDTISEVLFEAVRTFGGGRTQEDDQTLVVIKGSRKDGSAERGVEVVTSASILPAPPMKE